MFICNKGHTVWTLRQDETRMLRICAGSLYLAPPPHPHFLSHFLAHLQINLFILNDTYLWSKPKYFGQIKVTWNQHFKNVSFLSHNSFLLILLLSFHCFLYLKNSRCLRMLTSIPFFCWWQILFHSIHSASMHCVSSRSILKCTKLLQKKMLRPKCSLQFKLHPHLQCWYQLQSLIKFEGTTFFSLWLICTDLKESRL